MCLFVVLSHIIPCLLTDKPEHSFPVLVSVTKCLYKYEPHYGAINVA
jgi:hypothetical protein